MKNEQFILNDGHKASRCKTVTVTVALVSDSSGDYLEIKPVGLSRAPLKVQLAWDTLRVEIGNIDPDNADATKVLWSHCFGEFIPCHDCGAPMQVEMVENEVNKADKSLEEILICPVCGHED